MYFDLFWNLSNQKNPIVSFFAFIPFKMELFVQKNNSLIFRIFSLSNWISCCCIGIEQMKQWFDHSNMCSDYGQWFVCAHLNCNRLLNTAKCIDKICWYKNSPMWLIDFGFYSPLPQSVPDALSTKQQPKWKKKNRKNWTKKIRSNSAEWLNKIDYCQYLWNWKQKRCFIWILD